MEIRNRVVLGVNKKKTIIKRRRRRKRFVRKAVEYLKSDCYMYSHVVSCPPFSLGEQNSESFSAAGFGVEGLGGEKDKSLVKIVGDYIKSDSYMYASVADSDFTSLLTVPAEKAMLNSH